MLFRTKGDLLCFNLWKLRFQLLLLFWLLALDFLRSLNHFRYQLNRVWLCYNRCFDYLWWLFLSFLNYLHGMHNLLWHFINRNMTIHGCQKLNLFCWLVFNFLFLFCPFFLFFGYPTWWETLINQILRNFN